MEWVSVFGHRNNWHLNQSLMAKNVISHFAWPPSWSQPLYRLRYRGILELKICPYCCTKQCKFNKQTKKKQNWLLQGSEMRLIAHLHKIICTNISEQLPASMFRVVQEDHKSHKINKDMHDFRLSPPRRWDITQRTVLIPYRRFGTTYKYRLQG
jgi:hypothetical protein